VQLHAPYRWAFVIAVRTSSEDSDFLLLKTGDLGAVKRLARSPGDTGVTIEVSEGLKRRRKPEKVGVASTI